MSVSAIPVIAIDGPSASGKGTIAAAVAQRLVFHYLDSGALYRIVGLVAGERGSAIPGDGEQVQVYTRERGCGSFTRAIALPVKVWFSASAAAKPSTSWPTSDPAVQ